ncbi:MAG: hypothetical protein ACTHJ5_19290 [Ilyomonas sp.]
MKNILIAALVVGVAAAGVILYLNNRDELSETWDELSDSAEDAYDKANSKMSNAKRKAEQAFDVAVS